jgi:hypothetical protein
MAIDLHRFRIPRQKYLIFLEGIIDQWFLTSAAKEIAGREILLRRCEKAQKTI